MDTKKDRRIRKSKEALKNSLIELMKEKPVNNITVKELVLTADLNRSTFYNYYCDIPDMLQKLEMELYNELLEKVAETSEELMDKYFGGEELTAVKTVKLKALKKFRKKSTRRYQIFYAEFYVD